MVAKWLEDAVEPARVSGNAFKEDIADVVLELADRIRRGEMT
jgi:hypothetical protein